MISFTCAECHSKVSAPDDKCGHRCKCPKCKTKIVVPRINPDLLTRNGAPPLAELSITEPIISRRTLLIGTAGLTVFVCLGVAILIALAFQTNEKPAHQQQTVSSGSVRAPLTSHKRSFLEQSGIIPGNPDDFESMKAMHHSLYRHLSAVYRGGDQKIYRAQCELARQELLSRFKGKQMTAVVRCASVFKQPDIVHIENYFQTKEGQTSFRLLFTGGTAADAEEYGNALFKKDVDPTLIARLTDFWNENTVMTITGIVDSIDLPSDPPGLSISRPYTAESEAPLPLAVFKLSQCRGK